MLMPADIFLMSAGSQFASRESHRHSSRATIAAMIASQEVKTGSVDGEEDEDLAARALLPSDRKPAEL
jgi:hypothetical protein